MWSHIRCAHQNQIERGWQMERVLTCCVRLSMPLKTSPKDPLPIRSCLVNMSSGSTFCKNKRSVRKQVRHIMIWKGYANGVTHSRRVMLWKGIVDKFMGSAANYVRRWLEYCITPIIFTRKFCTYSLGQQINHCVWLPLRLLLLQPQPS